MFAQCHQPAITKWVKYNILIHSTTHMLCAEHALHFFFFFSCSSFSSSSLSSTTEDCGPSIVVPVVLYRFDSCVTWSNSKFDNRSQLIGPLRGIKPPLENEFR
uniref:Uncharacterized protein n=1 Tax=Cacopsylla melanoneura TaxID=428564 RepID=A0A8D9AA22_9HEMI